MFVGLCGPMGAGKTTAAKYLVDEHGFERIPFAKILKDMGKAFGLTNEQLYGDLKEEPVIINGVVQHWTPREFMQWLGTEFGRERLGYNIWVDMWKQSVAGFGRVVVDDVRFANEADTIHALGGKVILIDRGIKWSDGGHSSEHWHKLQWDIGITNVGEPRDLYQGLERVLWPAERVPA